MEVLINEEQLTSVRSGVRMLKVDAQVKCAVSLLPSFIWPFIKSLCSALTSDAPELSLIIALLCQHLQLLSFSLSLSLRLRKEN